MIELKSNNNTQTSTERCNAMKGNENISIVFVGIDVTHPFAIVSSIDCIILLELYETIGANKCNILIGLLHFLFPIIFQFVATAKQHIFGFG